MVDAPAEAIAEKELSITGFHG